MVQFEVPELFSLLPLVSSENGILLFVDKCFVTTRLLARKGGLPSQMLTAIGLAPTYRM